MSEARSVRRLAVEAAVIVGSILVAFAIDAWWDGRQEAGARQALFTAYASDLTTMRAELERVRGNHSRGADAIAALISLREEGKLGQDDAARVDSLFAVALFGGSFDAPVGAARATVSGGDLSYLRNPDLIAASNDLLAHAEDLEREQTEMAVELNAVSRVLVGVGVDVSDLWQFEVEPGNEPWVSRPTSTWSIVTRHEVRSALSELYWQYLNTVTVLAEIEGLLDRVEAAIEGGG